VTVRLRPARTDDRELLEAWDRKQHVIDATGDDDGWDWAAELPRRVEWRELLLAEEDGRPVGFLQIIDAREEETHYWGEVEPGFRAIDVWIGDESDLGRGLGTEMMDIALERCFADPSVHTVLIDPLERNVAARRFYARLGFEEVGRRRFGDDDCMVMRLSRRCWEETAR
jgi:aminoglycoside 6'-N-acetyltransferase